MVAALERRSRTRGDRCGAVRARQRDPIHEPGTQTNPDGSTTFFLTVTNVGNSVATYAFTGGTGADWTYGDNTLSSGETQRWWLYWPGYPGVEIIGVRCITPGGEIDYGEVGMQANSDGSTTYYLTITNVSPIDIEYRFVGFAIC